MIDMDLKDKRIYENNELVNKTNKYIIDCYKNGKLTNNQADDMNNFNLGQYYTIQKNYPKAIEYYMIAIEYENNKAMNNLGNYYYNIEKNYPKAIEYYTMAIEKGNDMAINNLGTY